MASLAVLLKNDGYQVTGSDWKLYPPMSDYLANHQIPVFEGFLPENIDHAAADLHIIGNVVSRGNPELEELLNRRLAYTSFPEFLKTHYLAKRKPIVIAGTHGKSTTSALVAHLLETAGLNPGFLVGGLPGNFPVSARPGLEQGHFVIEGDEYDTSFYDKRAKFFHYLPQFFLVNNLEFDHGDIYPDLAAIEKAFQTALRLIPKNGKLLLNADSPHAFALKPYSFSETFTFGFSEEADARIIEAKPTIGSFGYSCQFSYQGKTYRFSNKLAGKFNLSNSLAAFLLALWAGAQPEEINRGFQSFVTTKRRLEVLLDKPAFMLIDDFAHHPTAIQEGVRAVKEHFPDHRLIVAYEPRSNTSLSKVHQATLGKAFAGAEEAHLFKTEKLKKLAEKDRLDFEKVVSDMEQVGVKGFVYLTIAELEQSLAKTHPTKTVLLIMSQGDFGGLTPKLRTYFS